MKTMNDYGKRDRIARSSLAKHAARMNELIAAGMDRIAASRQAFEEMTVKQRNATAEKYGANEAAS